MAIHGYRQTDSIFSGKLGSLRKSFKQKIDFHFVRAPHSVPALESNNEPVEPGTEGKDGIFFKYRKIVEKSFIYSYWEKLAKFLLITGIPNFDDILRMFGCNYCSAVETMKSFPAAGWWFNTEDHVFKAIEPSDICVGFEESLAVIEKTCNDFGPFDGIIGFSQGAAFVAILCAMQQKKCKCQLNKKWRKKNEYNQLFLYVSYEMLQWRLPSSILQFWYLVSNPFANRTRFTMTKNLIYQPSMSTVKRIK